MPECDDLGEEAKMAEKARSVDVGGTGAITDIGRCREKNEARVTSALALVKMFLILESCGAKA